MLLVTQVHSCRHRGNLSGHAEHARGQDERDPVSKEPGGTSLGTPGLRVRSEEVGRWRPAWGGRWSSHCPVKLLRVLPITWDGQSIRASLRPKVLEKRPVLGLSQPHGRASGHKAELAILAAPSAGEAPS